MDPKKLPADAQPSNAASASKTSKRRSKTIPLPAQDPAPAPTGYHPLRNTSWDPEIWSMPVCVAIALLVLGVFLRSVPYAFLQYDDNQYIQEIPAVIAGLKWESVKWAWTHSHVGQWHPLTTMSFMLDSSLGAMKDGHGFHRTNVLLHALASVLLLLALRSLTGSLWRSAIASAIFAIHPLRAESVAWITERKDVLSGCFLMANLWVYSVYARKPESWKRFGAVVLMFTLGLLSKPMLVSLPAVFLLLDIWPLKRLSWDPLPQSREELQAFLAQLWPLIREKVPLLLLAGASAIGAIYAQGDPFRPIPKLPLLPRWSYIPSSYTTYLQQFFYPVNLAPHYPYAADGSPLETVLLCSAFLLAISVLAWKVRKTYPFLLMGWLWFLGTLLPVIGIVSPGIQIVADRYTYLTQIGLAIALVWTVAHWIESGKLPLRKPATAVLTGLGLLTLSVLAAKQTTIWENDSTLWEHCLAVTKNNDYASEKMATTLQSKGEKERSEALYREAIRLNPRLVGSLNNLSILLRSKGAFDEAADLQRKAVNEHPRWGLMHRNMAAALIQQKKFSEAKAEFQEALRLDPNDIEAEFHYALLLAQADNTPEALQESIQRLQKLVLRIPNFVEAHFNLGNLYFQTNRPDDALLSYQKTLAFVPNHSRANNNVGSVLLSKGRPQEAVEFFKKAVAAEPNYLEAVQNLAEATHRAGDFAQSIPLWRQLLTANPNTLQFLFKLSWLLATSPDGNLRRPFEAKDLATQGIELSGGKEAAFYDVLAAAQSHLGKFPEACEAIQKAEQLLQGNPAALTVIRQRKALYEAGQPFVEALQTAPNPTPTPNTPTPNTPAPQNPAPTPPSQN
jgi:tetratricopeptide (TPR) repeat protein